MDDSIGFIFAEIDQDVRKILNELEDGHEYSFVDGRLRIHVDRQIWRAASIAAGVTYAPCGDEDFFVHLLDAHRKKR